MARRFGGASLGLLILASASVRAAEPKTAAEIIAGHDRAVMRDLDEYVKTHPKAEDKDEAYSALFDRAIEHEWFAEVEPVASRYLAEDPDGGAGPSARFVEAMARAKAGKFAEALKTFRGYVKALQRDDQEEFAANFADHLAGAATTAGEFALAREVYAALLEKFDRVELREKVEEELERLDRVGKPAPALSAKDIEGKPVKLSDYKGKYVLVDFWATWCAPCLAELPNLRKAYEKHHKQGFEVLAVSLDDGAEAVTDFAKARDVPWRVIHNATAGADLVAAFGVANIPASFLVGPDGTILRLDLHGPALEQVLGKSLKSGK